MNIPEALLRGRSWKYFQILPDGELKFKHPVTGRIYEGEIRGSMTIGYYVSLIGETNSLPFILLSGQSNPDKFKLEYIYHYLHYSPRDGDFPYVHCPEDAVRVLAKIDYDLFAMYNHKYRVNTEVPLTPEDCLANAQANAIPEEECYPGAEEPKPDLFPTKKHYSLKFEL